MNITLTWNVFAVPTIPDEGPVWRQVSQHHYLLKTEDAGWDSENVPGERNIYVVWKFKLLILN